MYIESNSFNRLSLFSLSTTSSFLEAALTEISIQECALLLEILDRIVNMNYEYDSSEEKIKLPSISNVLNWLSALLDVKFGQIVINQECHQAFFRLNKSLRSLKRNYFQATKSYKAIVSQIELAAKKPHVKSSSLKRKSYEIELLYF